MCSIKKKGKLKYNLQSVKILKNQPIIKKILLLFLFPILLNAQTTLILQPGVEGKDAVVLNYSAGTYNTTNYGDTKDFYSWSWTWEGGNPVDERSLIQFDLSTMPKGAKIISANLTLYADNFTGINIKGHNRVSNSNASYLKRITSSWEENKVTWNTQPSTTSINQITLPKSTSGGQDYVVNVTSHVADMYQNPDSNHGFMLQLIKEMRYAGLFFASSDHPNPALRPKLEIRYTTADDIYYVPDMAFRTALKLAYPSCFTSSDSLIKSCANAATKINLNVIGKGISSIEGIEHFTNLKNLYCSFNNLSTIPTLPVGLTFIDASRNCFCSTPPSKPSSIPESSWIIEPNKSSCIVHVTVKEAEYETQINKPVDLKVGKSLFFDGIDDYITLPDLPNATTFTIEFWAKPVKLPVQFSFDELKDILNEWNHLAITKTANTLQFYKNGVLRATKTVNNTTTLASLVLGLGNNKYSGYLNELKIWKTVRTVSELKASMINFSENTHPDLVGAWNMTAHSGTEIKDYSTNANHGKSYGCTWQNEDNALSYSWSPKVNLSNDKGRNVTFNSASTGIFNYNVTATNAKGCKASKEVKVTIKNTAPLGSSFQNPIELGELSEGRTRFTTYTGGSLGYLATYYSFTINDTANLGWRSVPTGLEFLENNGGLYDDNYIQISNYKGKKPGKYYLVIRPYIFDYETNRIDVSITDLYANYCHTKAPEINLNDAIVISEAAGACLHYTDIRKSQFVFTCNAGFRPKNTYYKITLNSAQVLNVNACGTDNSFWHGTPKITVLDSSINELIPQEPIDMSDCIEHPLAELSNPYYMYELEAGTYYITTSYKDDSRAVHLNVSINGTSCSSLRIDLNEVANEVDFASLVALSPNPSSGKTNLSLPVLTENVSVTISDLSGKIVRTLVASNSVTEINTEELSEGLYYVSFLYQNKSVIKKLMVTK